jgi:CheY-like chemotaxis protein
METDRLRIVVLDDVQDQANALTAHLELEGYSAEALYCAEEALLRIEARPPHCVLFDINMPGMDGYEFATRMRARYKDDIVLIAVTGADVEELRVRDTFSVVDHYFQKPVEPEAFRKVLPQR